MPNITLPAIALALSAFSGLAQAHAPTESDVARICQRFGHGAEPAKKPRPDQIHCFAQVRAYSLNTYTLSLESAGQTALFKVDELGGPASASLGGITVRVAQPIRTGDPDMLGAWFTVTREGPAPAEDSQADVALANDFLPLSKGDAFSFDAPNGQKVTMRFLKSQG